jgi:hypothetical protein
VNARTASRRLYNLTGAVQKFNDRSRGGNSQEVSAQASWRDWQLVVTTSEFLPGEDGTPVMQEITQVFTLASPSAITVHVTRQGAKTDHWTVKLQRLNR